MKEHSECPCGIARVDCMYHRPEEPKAKGGIQYYDPGSLKIYFDGKLLEPDAFDSEVTSELLAEHAAEIQRWMDAMVLAPQEVFRLSYDDDFEPPWE